MGGSSETAGAAGGAAGAAGAGGVAGRGGAAGGAGSADGAPAAARALPGARAGVWIVAIAFAVGMAFSSAPSPLLPIYEERQHYTTTTVTLIFAIYPLGVMAGLFLLGHLSDREGRRRALIAALAFELASAVCFLLATELALLLVARVLCGLGVGILTATAAAWLSELDRGARPRGPRRSDVITTAANLGGIGAGTLLAGALATLAPAPLRVPYAVLLALLAGSLLAILRVPETTAPVRPRPRYRVQRVAVPRRDRRAYLAACAGGFLAFSLLTLFSALSPIFLVETLGERSHLLAGAVTCCACLAAAGGQLSVARMAVAAQRWIAFGGLVAGSLVIVAAVAAERLPLYFVGALVGGFAAGVLFKLMVARVDALAEPGARAEAFAGFYLLTYANATLPLLALGWVTQTQGVLTAVLVYTAFAVIAAAAIAVELGRG